MMLSSVLLLVSESLIRAHQQFSADEGSLSRPEVGKIAYSLGPLSRLIYDQFAKVALKSVRVRRRNVLDSFDWPSSEARSRLEQLPVLGDDLFNDQFL